MHRSIAGLADALQSICDGKSTLGKKSGKKSEGESLKRIDADLEEVRQDVESNRRLNDASQYFAEIESCTSRITSKLREIDAIDLSVKPQVEEKDDEDGDPVSDQQRFLNDQCFRAQSLLAGEYYLRNLHTQEVNTDMADLDERITYTAKNWKHALVELGVSEADLADLQAPETEVAQESLPMTSDSKKVRRNSVITQARPSLLVEADYSEYNAAEFAELNEILSQFMDQTFLNGTNGHKLSREIMDRCTRFKQKMIDLTRQLVEDQRRSVKSGVRTAQRSVRSLEGEIALLHAQNDEADTVIRGQKESDKQICKLVEAKFADTMRQFEEHTRKIDAKMEAQQETNTLAQRRFLEVQGMFQELRAQRLHADPFLRRRAENLVKGLLRNLNETDLKEQEEREEEMQTSYQQWKKMVEFCAEKERQLQLMQVQERTVQEELRNHLQRIEQERVVYRQRVKVLKSRDDEQSAKLRILEETLSDKARNERRKLFFEQTALELRQMNTGVVEGDAESVALVNAEDSDLAAFEAKLQQDASSDADSENSSGSDSHTSDGLLDSDGSGSSSDGGDAASHRHHHRHKHHRSGRRVKQAGVRSVAPLCDPRTEALLGITLEHVQRQEITEAVTDHVPRPAVNHATGSEVTDSAALAKAQKLFVALHVSPSVAPTKATATEAEGQTSMNGGTQVPSAEGWIVSNSAPRSASVQFSAATSPGRRQSTFSSSKVKFGFWAEAEPHDEDYDDSSNSDADGGEGGAVSRLGTAGAGTSRGGTAERRQRAVAVHSLSSTACYVSLYYRYLKKFPNLNFRRDNPRLQAPTEETARSTAMAERRDSPVSNQNQSQEEPSDVPVKPVASEIVNNNNRFQFTIKEGLIVVKEAVDALFSAKCIDRIIVSDALEKTGELERRLKLLALPGEEPEVRYQLHYLCASLIHTTLSRAPQLLLLKNNRKLFVDINTSVLALLGVVLNCSLVFWQPASARWSMPSKSGGVAAERVEFICAHLIELVVTGGEIDQRRPLSSGLGGASPSTSARKTSTKNFRVIKPEDTPLGPAGFISLLRIQTGELLRKEHEKTKVGGSPQRPAPGTVDSGLSVDPTASAVSEAAPPAVVTNVYKKGVTINYHELFQVFNSIVDEETPIASSVGQEGMFTMKHRHAIFALQLFLYLALGNKEVNLSDAILMLHKGMHDAEKISSSGATDSVIPCDVDILLQTMHPGMVPALLSLELMRRVLEEEFRRVAFLKKIVESHPDVADLQYLNVQFSGQFDVGLKKGRESAGDSSVGSYGNSVKVSVPALTALVPAFPGLAAACGGAEVRTAALHVTRFKSTKEAHEQWVEDLQSHLMRLGNEISRLISPVPVGGSSVSVKAPSFLGTRAVATQPEAEAGTPPTIPLPMALVYRILAHINTLRTVTAAHSVNGLLRVQATQAQFVGIMKDLLAARSRILSIVTAMTWPMRKKLDWLKMKYNTILEENAGATQQVGAFHKLVERYEQDIATYKASILLVDREKHTIEYRRTRMLQLGLHDPQIQQLIVEHCTDETAQKLAEIKAREARLNATIAQFSDEFDHLNAQSETLKAAQRSLSSIEQAQIDAERGLDERQGIHTPTFEPLEGIDGFDGPQEPPKPSLNIRTAPKVPPPVSEFLNAVDAFVRTERMAEAVAPAAFVDPPQVSALNAKRVEDAAKAKAAEQRRLRNLVKERMMNRPRLPLFGVAAALLRREKPSLPAKLLSFANRIDSGLIAVGAPNYVMSNTSGGRLSGQNSEITLDISDSESDSNNVYHKSARGHPTGIIAGAMMKEGTRPDIFGQHKPSSLRDRVQRQMLKKGAGKLSSAKQRMHEVVHQYMISNYGGAAFDPHSLDNPPPDSPLIVDNNSRQLPPPSTESTEEQRRRAVLTIPAAPVLPDGYVHMPALEQIGRKELAFMSPLSRKKKFHYDEVLRGDGSGDSTPLDVKSLITAVIQAQREEARFSRESPDGQLDAEDAENDNIRRAQSRGSRGQSSGSRARSAKAAVEFSDDLLEDEDEFDAAALGNMSEGRDYQKNSNQHSSRDQNVGTGITYAEYLLWKSKRRQQQREEQQLEALKKSLNIQLRGARRNMSVDANTIAEDAPSAAAGDDAVLTEAEFDKLLQQGESTLQLAEERGLRRDYTGSNSEVDFILSRCSSRAESVKFNRKYSSKRGSVGGALHFNTAALSLGTDDHYRSPALAEAGRRARGESVRSARASLSLRTRASLLQKLGNLVELSNARKTSMGGEVPLTGSLAGSQSVRHTFVDKLGTISERGALRSSVVSRKSTYGKPAPSPALPLEEARIIAHTIVHGAPPPAKKRSVVDGLGGALSTSPPKPAPEDSANSRAAFGAGYDMQILQYIANDELILSGWENVDLFAMNEKETFSGHTFRFDDLDDRARAAVLKDFAAKVAVSAEESASAVENEFRAAIVNLNRLVGKKITDAEVKVLPAEDASSTAAPPLAPPQELASPLLASSSQAAIIKPSAPKGDRHRHHNAILSGAQGGLERANSYDRHTSTVSIAANGPPIATVEGSSAVHIGESSTANEQPSAPAPSENEQSTARSTTPMDEEVRTAEPTDVPRRPSEPKPSATFASPRKKTVTIAAESCRV